MIEISPCTGIEVNTASSANLVIYPNPSTGEFTITSDQTILLQITNELGQQIKTVSLISNNPEAKINNLANGVYFITAETKTAV